MVKHKNVPLKNEYWLLLIIAIMMGGLGQTLIPWIATQLNLYYFNFRFNFKFRYLPFYCRFSYQFQKP